jgi:hypothetical protein
VVAFVRCAGAFRRVPVRPRWLSTGFEVARGVVLKDGLIYTVNAHAIACIVRSRHRALECPCTPGIAALARRARSGSLVVGRLGVALRVRYRTSERAHQGLLDRPDASPSSRGSLPVRARVGGARDECWPPTSYPEKPLALRAGVSVPTRCTNEIRSLSIAHRNLMVDGDLSGRDPAATNPALRELSETCPGMALTSCDAAFHTRAMMSTRSRPETARREARRRVKFEVLV